MKFPPLLALALLAVFTLGQLTLILGYAYWGDQYQQNQLLQIGWSGVVFVLLSLMFLGTYKVAAFLSLHLFRRTKAFRPPDKVRIDGHRRLFLSQSVQAGLVLLSAGLTRYACLHGAALPLAREVPLLVKGLPKDLEGFRIVHLTDIHADDYTTVDWMRAVVDIANSLAPDLIAVTGDLADSPVDQISTIISPLSELSADFGSYFVTGNHEYYIAARGVEAWIAHLKLLGFDVLLNEHRLLTCGKGNILLGGVTDFNAEYSMPEHASKPSAAIRNAPPSDVKILLAHQPKSIYEAAEAGFDFQLSGHTHGGKIFPGHVLMAMTQPFLSGMHRYRDTQIYVSPGTGCWGPKLRLGSTAEIAAIVLSAA